MGAIGERADHSSRSVKFGCPTRPSDVQAGGHARSFGMVWGRSSTSGPQGIRSPESPSGVSFSTNPRCLEKGCVFPAVSSVGGICYYHTLEQREPGCFRSYQPSRLLLEKAKFGLLCPGFENDRARDRRLLGGLREKLEETG